MSGVSFQQADGQWFWGVSFQLTGGKSYGRADSIDGAKAAVRVEYEGWQREAADGPKNH
jgi:hypothetical protein